MACLWEWISTMVCVWTGCELTLLTLSHHADAGISWRLPHSDPRNERAEGPGKEYGSAFRTEALITCVRWAFLILLTGVILLNFLLLTYSAESIVVWYCQFHSIQPHLHLRVVVMELDIREPSENLLHPRSQTNGPRYKLRNFLRNLAITNEKILNFLASFIARCACITNPS